MLKKSMDIQIRYNLWHNHNKVEPISYNEETPLRVFAEEMILKQLATGQSSGSFDCPREESLYRCEWSKV